MTIVEKVKSYLGVGAENEIRSVLHDDHEEILALVRDMSSESTAAKRRVYFDVLKPLLTAHARAEEAVVYTQLVGARASKESKELGNEGFVEHSLVDVVLERLSKTRLAGTDAWKAHATVLKELLEHHIKEEEDEIFGELGHRFNDAQLNAMGTTFLEQKNRRLRAKKTARRAA
jgi:hemerythrin superfamily protein